ncbi:cold-shock protein [Chloroflexota bacterium]
MPKGTIKTLTDRGFGFIKTEEETDIFFHRSVLEGVEFSNLREGQEVEFEKGQGRDGRPAAVKVSLAETQASDEGGDAPASDDGGDAPGGDEGEV